MGLHIERGDITTYAVDAIVNAANCTLLGGGGVDGAIHRAAGPELLAECRTLHGCRTGQAKLTRGYRLWYGGCKGEAQALRACYENALRLAEEYGCETVAFPSISTGVYRYPLDQAAAFAVDAIETFLKTARSVRTVTMVCFDDATLAAYRTAQAARA